MDVREKFPSHRVYHEPGSLARPTLVQAKRGEGEPDGRRYRKIYRRSSSFARPCRRLGLDERYREHLWRNLGVTRRARRIEAAEQAQGRDVRIVRLAQTGQLFGVRVLRERREGDLVGADQGSLHARLLFRRRPYSDRIARMVGSRAGEIRPPDPPDEIRCRVGSVCPDRLGRSLRPDRRDTTRPAARRRGVLRFRPCGAGGFLSLRAVGARVWQQQSAAKLEHVPRDDFGRAHQGDRVSGRHRYLRRSGRNRLLFLFRPEPGHQ